MRNLIADAWLRVRDSYWFVPSLFSLCALAAAFVMVAIDRRLDLSMIEHLAWLYTSQPEGAHALLSTVAGSMITVAGVTFSLTLLAVSHASAQIGPRLLTGFMRDRGNQITLGTFIGTFLYCLIVLRTVRTASAGGGEAEVFVPHLAVVLAVVLAIASVVVLIYFFQHVPQTMNVTRLTAGVGDQLLKTIECLYPEGIGTGEPEEEGEQQRPPQALRHRARITATKAGYLRLIDADGLMTLTTKHDLTVTVLKRPGEFAMTGDAFLLVDSPAALDDQVKKQLFSLVSQGHDRTPEQDVLFSAEQLLEVLGKAMSPGINGQFTALLCLDQLHRALVALLQRRVPARQQRDAEGRIRVVARPVSHREFVEAVCLSLRQFIAGDFLVTARALGMLDQLLELTDAAGKAAVAEQRSAVLMELKESPMPIALKENLLKTAG